MGFQRTTTSIQWYRLNSQRYSSWQRQVASKSSIVCLHIETFTFNFISSINIRDPLAGIDAGLKNALAGIQTQFGQISQQWTNSIKVVKFLKLSSKFFDLQGICQRMNCMQQQQKNIQMKQDILKNVVNFEKRVFGNDVADRTNMRFDRTLQLKQALLEKANLKGVVCCSPCFSFQHD